MSKYVLRTRENCQAPELDVVELKPEGMGRSVAWFWNEDDAREYMNLKATVESLRNELVRLRYVVGEIDVELIDKVLEEK